MELLPETGYIQAQSSYSVQLKFLPRWVASAQCPGSGSGLRLSAGHVGQRLGGSRVLGRLWKPELWDLPGGEASWQRAFFSFFLVFFPQYFYNDTNFLL